MASPRPARPLNPKAVAAADDALYDAHKDDPPPNPLFDADGNRVPLSATDPSQKSLREQWIKLYGENGGKLEAPKPKTNKRPREAVVKCPVQKARLTVHVHYDPVDAPVKNANVTIKGPVTKTQRTDDTGTAKFENLPPGQYEITVVYVGKNALVDLARSHNGSKDWAYDVERKGPLVQAFPSGTNKCNLFVYEMLTDAGYPVPTKTHQRRKLGIPLGTTQIPPNAGDWASPSQLTGTASVVPSPEPGDVVAWSHPEYADATGHCGIVSYPEPSVPMQKSLAAGDDATAKVIMRRTTVSAHGDEVVEDTETFWHYYDEGKTDETNRITFRHPTK